MAEAEETTNVEDGPWIKGLPAMIAALRSDVPLESLQDLRTDLVSMALLADRYVRLVESKDESVTKWGECPDPASPEGAHQRAEICLFCGGRP